MKSCLSTIPYLEYHETHFGKHWPQLLPLASNGRVIFLFTQYERPGFVWIFTA